MIVWHAHTLTQTCCRPSLHSLLKSLFPLYHHRRYCVYFLLLFISYFIYTQYVISFKPFSSQLWWSYSDCNRTGIVLYANANVKTKPIEWANHLSETLRNKCYFIHLYSNFSIIITVSLLSVSSMSLHVTNPFDYLTYSFVSLVPFGVTCVIVCVCVCDAQTIASIHIFYCVIIPFYQNWNERVQKLPKGSRIKKEKGKGNKKRKWEAENRKDESEMWNEKITTSSS